MSKKKSWIEKLHDSKDLPKIVNLEGKQAEKWGEGKMVVPAPIEVYEIMKLPQKGKLLTVGRIRELLAEKHGVEIACPLTTGIFTWIAANASEEMKAKGKEYKKKDLIPWWRTLKAKGELNPKYPGGIEKQMELLEAEGFKIVPKGKKFVVADYEKYLV